jgi:hypothetical protein
MARRTIAHCKHCGRRIEWSPLWVLWVHTSNNSDLCDTDMFDHAEPRN